MTAYKGAALKEELAGAKSLIVQDNHGRTPVLAARVGEVIQTPAIAATGLEAQALTAQGLQGPQIL